jgi:hypothetical protein
VPILFYVGFENEHSLIFPCFLTGKTPFYRFKDLRPRKGGKKKYQKKTERKFQGV